MKRIAAVLAVLLLVVAAGCDRTDLIGSPQNGQIVPGDTVTVTVDGIGSLTNAVAAL